MSRTGHDDRQTRSSQASTEGDETCNTALFIGSDLRGLRDKAHRLFVVLKDDKVLQVMEKRPDNRQHQPEDHRQDTEPNSRTARSACTSELKLKAGEVLQWTIK